MKEIVANRLARLLCVKSLVTLILTVVFAMTANTTVKISVTSDLPHS